MGTEYATEGAPAYPPEADQREVMTAETIRTRFDCSGSVWADRKSPSGASCHAMPWPTGAPLLAECGVYIEAGAGAGSYKSVRAPEGAKWDPYEIGDAFLFGLGGGRKYRVSLRHASKTIPHSYLVFDLTGHGAPTQLPGEETTPAQRAAPEGPPQPAAEVLALGADPFAAMIGASVAAMAPEQRLMFAFMYRDSQRAEMWATKQVEHMSHFFAQMTGVMKEAARGSGNGGEVAALLRAQSEAASRAAEEASRVARETREQLHAKELAEARAANKDAMSPAVPLVIGAVERIAGLGLKTAIETAGPAAAQKAVDAITGAAATAAAAAG